MSGIKTGGHFVYRYDFVSPLTFDTIGKKSNEMQRVIYALPKSPVEPDTAAMGTHM